MTEYEMAVLRNQQKSEDKKVQSEAFRQASTGVNEGVAQGNTGQTAGSALMAAGSIPSPASPALMGAGLGLSVLGAAEQNKRNNLEAQRKAYNDRITQRQQLMSQIASQGIE